MDEVSDWASRHWSARPACTAVPSAAAGKGPHRLEADAASGGNAGIFSLRSPARSGRSRSNAKVPLICAALLPGSRQAGVIDVASDTVDARGCRRVIEAEIVPLSDITHRNCGGADAAHRGSQLTALSAGAKLAGWDIVPLSPRLGEGSGAGAGRAAAPRFASHTLDAAPAFARARLTRRKELRHGR
jgi:hypothetical protein